MTRVNELSLGDSFLQQLIGNIIKPVVAQATANVTSSAPVQAALVQAQDAARKAEILAWALGLTWGATFIFYVVPRMEAPWPRALRRRKA